MSETTDDLNATIAAAVNARISAQVAQALAGDEVIGQYVAAALSRTVEIRQDYKTIRVPFIDHALETAMQSATKQAIAEVIESEIDVIREAVREGVRNKLGTIADGFSNELVETAKRSYGIRVAIEYPER